jgi:hypothetical protein
VTLTAARPRVATGDLWRYARLDRLHGLRFEDTRRVVEVDARRIVCELGSTAPHVASGRAEYTREWNLLSRPAARAADGEPDEDNRWRWTPHYPQFRFPLAAGKQWSGRATAANRATGTSNLHVYRARVLPAERIEVPAGTFETLPVRFESGVQSSDGEGQQAWRNVETLYYAPRVNLFARYEQAVTGPDGQPASDTQLELLQYRPV